MGLAGMTMTLCFMTTDGSNRPPRWGRTRYADSNHPDAVTAAGGHSSAYDSAGNMVTRTLSGQTAQTIGYNADNRPETITEGSTTTEFLYTVDGGRIAPIDDGTS